MTNSKHQEEIGPRVLQAVAECMRCEVAVFWTVDAEAEVLRQTHVWQAPWAEAAFVEAMSRTTVLARGEGVAGRAWSTGEPVWKPRACAPEDVPSRPPRACTAALACRCTIARR